MYLGILSFSNTMLKLDSDSSMPSTATQKKKGIGEPDFSHGYGGTGIIDIQVNIHYLHFYTMHLKRISLALIAAATRVA